MRYLGNLGGHFSVPLPPDKEGYIGRECPNCQGYFKAVPGTGLKNATNCHCPYCGHIAHQSRFTTRDQIEYAKSVAIRRITDAITAELKGLEFDVKPSGAFGIRVSIKVQPGQPHPIRWYREKALETHIECPNCTLRYAVFGVFAFCPDCGQHNSLFILHKNLEIVGKMLDMASSVEGELAQRLIENALEDCVSSFDAFAREVCRIKAQLSVNSDEALKISFQNLTGARQKVRALFKLDLASGLEEYEWKAAIRAFHKRHLLAHKMGVVDEEYVLKSGDASAVVGHKVRISSDEVRQLIRTVGKVAEHFAAGLQSLENKP
jgi:hypothetical protein